MSRCLHDSTESVVIKGIESCHTEATNTHQLIEKNCRYVYNYLITLIPFPKGHWMVIWLVAQVTVGKRNYFTVYIPYFMLCKFCISNTWTTLYATSFARILDRNVFYSWFRGIKRNLLCWFRTVKFLLHDWSWSTEEGCTKYLVKHGILHSPFIVIALGEQYSNYRKFVK